MSNIVVGSRSLDWIEMSRYEREAEPLSRVFEFFPRNSSRLHDESMPIGFFLRLILSDPSSFALDEVESGIAAMLALQLPDMVLSCLQRNLAETSSWHHARQEMPNFIADHYQDSNVLFAYLSDFVRRYESDNPYENAKYDPRERYEINEFCWKIAHNEDFVTLAKTARRAKKHALENQGSGLDQSRRSDVERSLDDGSSPALGSGNLDVEGFRIDDQYLPGATEPRVRYLKTRKLREDATSESELAYAALTNAEAWNLRGRRNLPYIVVCYLGLFWCLATSIFHKSLGLISLAHAQSASEPQAASKPEVPFTHPPLGLSHDAWQFMTVAFFLWVLATLSVFLWKGYLAKEKSETAADTVKNLLVMGIGLFFGKVVSG